MPISTHPIATQGFEADDEAELEHIRAEYVDMPGLNLTVPQAARLFDLSVAEAEHLLSEMEHEHFLERDTDGLYTRRGCRHCWEH